MDKLYYVQSLKLIASYTEIIYIGLVIFCIVFRVVIGDIGWVALFFSLFPNNLIPLIILNVVGLAQHRIISYSSLFVILIIICLVWVPKLYPFRYSNNQKYTDNKLRIYSHNTGQYTINESVIIRQIHELQPDIVVLQEVNWELFKTLETTFGQTYTYIHAGPFVSTARIGMLFMSRYEITKADDYKLDQEGLVFQQDVYIRQGESTIRFVNVHTTFPWFKWIDTKFYGLKYFVYDDSIRKREITSLLRGLGEDTTKTILAGDFNMSNYSADYYAITTRFSDSQTGIYQSFTWPAADTSSLKIPIKLPIIKVDYVFHTPDIQVCESMVQSSTGSDHLPIFVVLSW